jgi:hypothetical protein
VNRPDQSSSIFKSFRESQKAFDQLRDGRSVPVRFVTREGVSMRPAPISQAQFSIFRESQKPFNQVRAGRDRSGRSVTRAAVSMRTRAIRQARISKNLWKNSLTIPNCYERLSPGHRLFRPSPGGSEPV